MGPDPLVQKEKFTRKREWGNPQLQKVADIGNPACVDLFKKWWMEGKPRKM